ncbi:N-acetylglucosaminyl-phosphatidylinositol de-N-acetylase [Exophiala xenobiotica]|nr:N-acetylglucosaminyl-phosphatidylinositol de-N-acetylase [Exophiala xenobiotica]
MANETITFPAWAVYLFLVPVFIFGIWQLNSAILPPPPPPAALKDKRVILLIAHPDDESMFFSPTLLGLTGSALGNHVKILCLSTGNADGLGETRKKELEAAAVKLGVRNREDVLTMEDPRFKDGMKEQWDEKEIAKVLAQAFAPNTGMADASEKKKNKKTASSKEGPRATIDALITFDRHGVSSHPNHIALFRGAKHFLGNLMRDHSGYSCPVTMYTLTSINVLRKYSFVLDVAPTYFVGLVSDIFAGASGKKKAAKKGMSKGSKGDRVIFTSDISRYLRARDAMVNGHRSQMIWFRWGWIGIGRYMVVNDLKREDI